ncbi:MAG: polyprenyl diphosphate synthase [Candidatus Caenarcaniphilales bacterium]|nr:polyprenyl diphosphate synthase [Candidatus Caenarcaniphilales bacterium]
MTISEKTETKCSPVGLIGCLKHVAIILDGNRRWAEQMGLPLTSGHKEGVKTLKKIVKACTKRKIAYLTVYVFSTENWNRPELEVDFLFQLFDQTLERELDELEDQGVRLRFIGDLNGISQNLIDKIKAAEKRTLQNQNLNLQIALNYGSRHELVQVVQGIARKVKKGEIDPEKIDESILQAHLYTADLPDPELLIRTGGEQRLSNYLLWQAAYTELIFSSTLWPLFTEDDFDACLAEYLRRDRRFGC